MSNIKMDYMDILLKQVNLELTNHRDALMEMRDAEDSHPAYIKAYILQTINQIFYHYDLAYDVYMESRKNNMLKKRHHTAYRLMYDLKVDIDCLIQQSGYARNVSDAHDKANKL